MAADSLFNDLPWSVEKRDFQPWVVLTDATGCDQVRLWDTEVAEAVAVAVNGYTALREWVASVLLMVELNALDAAGIEGIRRTGKELLGG